MRNLKLEIEYDGTNYAGWQIQRSRSSKKTIQEVIEKALQKIIQEKIRIISAGRTDAGVHAQGQVINFKTNSTIALGKLHRALNGILPEDITINKIEEVTYDFHSRFYAKSKVYRYSILNRKFPSALLRNRVYFYDYPLNLALMRREARCLLGEHDFSAFCASGSGSKNRIRTIKRISITKPKDKGIVLIEIEADGFLYNMVRNIVGTLLEIGRGRFPEGSLRQILHSKDRKCAGPTAPAYGLCLLRVKY